MSKRSVSHTTPTLTAVDYVRVLLHVPNPPAAGEHFYPNHKTCCVPDHVTDGAKVEGLELRCSNMVLD